MQFNPDLHRGDDTDEILGRLIDHVSKTEEELREEAEEERKKTTDLKLFIARKEGFELGTIEERLHTVTMDDSTHQYTVNFIDDHGFTESLLNEETSLLQIRTPSYNRQDHAILIDTGNYLRIFSTERRYWTKRTIEKVIEYLPGLSRLYLSADDIGTIVSNLEDITETHVSGFTSKYQSYDDDRRISIQFHGGSEKDIKHIEKEFNAKPTRVEFKQKNSPADAVNGAITRDARINIPGIRSGAEQLGADTLESVAEGFEEKDKEHYNVPFAPEMLEGPGGLEIEGFTSVRLSDDQEFKSQPLTDGGETQHTGDRAVITGLKDEVLDKKRRYEFSEWGDKEFLVLDTERTETFHVGVSGQDLVLNARPGTTPITIKEFCKIILEEFKSTYNISSRSTDLNA